jgi:hypothetical protein
LADYAPAPNSADEPGGDSHVKKNGLTAAEEKQILEEARRRMKRGLEMDSADRDRAQRELKFVWNADNCQWDDEAKRARKNRPMLTENRNPAFIRQATNEVRRSRPQIRVLPVDNQGDPATAQVYEGLIRNIEANSRADLAYDQAVDHAAYCGRGYWKVTTEYAGEGFDQDILIQPVADPFSIVDDPDCAMPDKSDRKFAFEVEKCARDEYEDRYGYKAPSFEEAAKALGDHAQNWGDEREIIIANYWRVVEEKDPIYRMSDRTITRQPNEHIAAVKQQQALVMSLAPHPAVVAPPLPTVKDKRDLVKRRVEWYCIDGLRAHSKGAWAGQFIPLVYTTSEQMKIDGKWATKGMTFDAQDLTKANNYLLSAQIENIALTPKNPFIGPKGAFDSDRAKWNSINQESYNYVEFDTVDAAGNPISLAPMRPEGVKANPEISNVRMGVIDGQRAVVGLMGASLGDRGPEQSFIAIEARQSRGDTAIFHVMDNEVRAVRYGGLVVVDLIPRVYSGPRVVRIINPDGEPVMQAINKAFVDTDGKTKQFNLDGKYDISVSAGPAFETQRQATNALLVDLVGKIPAMAMAAPDLIAKNLLAAGGDGEKIAQRLARTVPAEIRGEAPPPEVQQMQAQLQEMQKGMQQISTQKDFFESELAKQRSLLEKADIDKDRAAIDLQKKVAELEGALAKAEIEKQKAELALQRAQLEAIRAAMPPAPVAPLAAPPAPMQ